MTIRNMLTRAICSANFCILVTDMYTNTTYCANSWMEMVNKLESAGIDRAVFKWIDLCPDQIRFIVSSEVIE